MARTASRCTCGSVSSSSSVRSGSASLPPNCAHQVNRRAPDRRVLRVLQLLDRRAAPARRTQQNRRQPLARARAALRPTALRPAAAPAPRRASTHIALTRSNCASSIVRQVRGRRAASSGRRPARRSRSARAGARARRRRCRRPRRTRTPMQLAGRVEVADQQQIFDERDHRLHQRRASAPSSSSMRSRSSSSVRSSVAQRGRGDGAQPGG